MDDLICGYANTSIMIMLSERDGEIGGDRMETLADIRTTYGAIVGSLSEEPLPLAEDFGGDDVFLVWSGVTSEGALVEGAETFGFKAVDGQAKITFHIVFVKIHSIPEAGAAKGADNVEGGLVARRANVYLALYLSWVAEDLEGVMALFTEESTMLEYTFGQSDSVETVGGLAGIRSWFEAEIGTLAAMTEGPSLRAKPAELEASAEVWVAEVQSATLQLAMQLVSLDGATIAQFNVLKKPLGNFAGTADFVA